MTYEKAKSVVDGYEYDALTAFLLTASHEAYAMAKLILVSHNIATTMNPNHYRRPASPILVDSCRDEDI